MLSKELENKLKEPLPARALKPHPSKSYLTVINPMAVIDRLNEVFGTGGWKVKTEPINFVGKFAVVKVTLEIEEHNIHIEQYGGNDNTDVGDAYKGASTDALTKIASYLGIGASIYKGQGNNPVQNGLSEVAFERLKTAYKEKGEMNPDMQEYFLMCSASQKAEISKITKELRK